MIHPTSALPLPPEWIELDAIRYSENTGAPHLPTPRMNEIERRYLCGPVDESTLARADRIQRIRQGYLTREGPAIRVRQKDDAFLMTVKAGSGLVRREVEWPIPEGVARELFEIAGSRTLSKARHVFGRWEIDVFEGPFSGLVVAEVELERADEPTPASPEEVTLLCEITFEPGLTNQWLSQLGPEESSAFMVQVRAGPEAALAWVRAHPRIYVSGEAG